MSQVLNADVPRRSYWRVAYGSAAVVQQLATAVVVTAAVPLHLRRGGLAPGRVLSAAGVLLLLAHGACRLLGGHVLGGSLGRGARQGALLAAGVRCLSPLLHTLATTISPDSVVAMSALLTSLHLALHDYDFLNSAGPPRGLSGALSLSCGLLSAVLVASQMPSDDAVVSADRGLRPSPQQDCSTVLLPLRNVLR